MMLRIMLISEAAIYLGRYNILLDLHNSSHRTQPHPILILLSIIIFRVWDDARSGECPCQNIIVLLTELTHL